MSTGKRLAKRSIIGMRVCAPMEDGRFYPGVIHATKTEAGGKDAIIYCILFDEKKFPVKKFRANELIGPSFQNISSIKLKNKQKVYVTYNGREVVGTVVHHRPDIDQVILIVEPSSHNCHLTRPVELKKKIEEVRLIESRKSVRLLDNDTDYSKLAEGQEPRRRTSSLTIDVPSSSTQSGRKRRPSSAEDGDVMDECMAAMVLMSLSCSPKSPRFPDFGGYPYSYVGSNSSSDVSSWDSLGSSIRTSTPSPPSSSSIVATENVKQKEVQDEGIEMDESVVFMEESTVDKRKKQLVFQCTWPGCRRQYDTCKDIEKHVRTLHLRQYKQQGIELNDHEEEFYYTEIEKEIDVENQLSPSPSSETNGIEGLISPLPTIYTSMAPTLSHLDMVKPPEENPEFKCQQEQCSKSSPINIPQGQTSVIQWYPHHSYAASLPNTMVSTPKYIRLSPKSLSTSPKCLPQLRKLRSESRKCRKVYGMENKDMWCTQCKWKKACTRFVD
ncbi:zinc finger protein 395-like isoform X1 [Tachypleus tridentatus]|uniref:zinc finger protein 395-like isoform X1 n=1 Tax=Tachypleus tridentatus TaxID=6853 RepID=UPI003FD43E51